MEAGLGADRRDLGRFPRDAGVLLNYQYGFLQFVSMLVEMVPFYIYLFTALHSKHLTLGNLRNVCCSLPYLSKIILK